MNRYFSNIFGAIAGGFSGRIPVKIISFFGEQMRTDESEITTLQFNYLAIVSLRLSIQLCISIKKIDFQSKCFNFLSKNHTC
jgi:hypothetical protein